MVAAVGCASTPEPEPTAPAVPAVRATGPVRTFSFRALDGTTVSAASLRGRVSVIVLVTTYDDASHAQVLFLRALVRRHVPRVNALVLVLEPERNRPMAEAFASSLELAFPVAMADPATIEGSGPFPGLHHVPSVVILDGDGREVWRRIGLTNRQQLEEAVVAVEPELPTLRGQ
ncbi:MAG: TlpA family protein disulfide reductase [Deltaproteobacteria bacterium]|nr:TlpA family protein disulfide reductase [Deltaproteobacteria bacterium]